MDVGLDLLEVERMEVALARRPGLAAKLFTEGERAYAATRAVPAQHLAARFCAKEAVTKALGLDVFSPQLIEVAGGGSAEVGVVLLGEVASRADALGVAVAVSLTHTRAMAGAVAVLTPAATPTTAP